MLDSDKAEWAQRRLHDQNISRVYEPLLSIWDDEADTGLWEFKGQIHLNQPDDWTGYTFHKAEADDFDEFRAGVCKFNGNLQPSGLHGRTSSSFTSSYLNC